MSADVRTFFYSIVFPLSTSRDSFALPSRSHIHFHPVTFFPFRSEAQESAVPSQ